MGNPSETSEHHKNIIRVSQKDIRKYKRKTQKRRQIIETRRISTGCI